VIATGATIGTSTNTTIYIDAATDSETATAT
jgi:hypothetical protein